MSTHKTTKADLLRQVAKLDGQIEATAEAARRLEGLRGTHPDGTRLRERVITALFRERNEVLRRLEAMEPAPVRVVGGGYDLGVGEYFAELQPGRVA